MQSGAALSCPSRTCRYLELQSDLQDLISFRRLSGDDARIVAHILSSLEQEEQMPDNDRTNDEARENPKHALSRRDFLRILGSAGGVIPILSACGPAPAAQSTASPAQPTAAAAAKPAAAATSAPAAAAAGGGEIAIGAVVPLT